MSATVRKPTRGEAVKRTSMMICKYVEHLCAAQAHHRFTTSKPSILKDKSESPPTSFEYFSTVCEPSISFLDYVTHVVARVKCSPECFIFALAYLSRISRAGFPMTTLTVHRLFITAVVIAIKIRDDFFQNMSFYASVGGIEAKDLVTMERHFLFHLIHCRGEVLVEEYFATCVGVTETMGLVHVSNNVTNTPNDNELGALSETESLGLSRNTSAGSGHASPALCGKGKQLFQVGAPILDERPQQQQSTKFAMRKNFPPQKRASSTGPYPGQPSAQTTNELLSQKVVKKPRPSLLVDCAKVKLMQEWARECSIYLP